MNQFDEILKKKSEGGTLPPAAGLCRAGLADLRCLGGAKTPEAVPFSAGNLGRSGSGTDDRGAQCVPGGSSRHGRCTGVGCHACG